MVAFHACRCTGRARMWSSVSTRTLSVVRTGYGFEVRRRSGETIAQLQTRKAARAYIAYLDRMGARKRVVFKNVPAETSSPLRALTSADCRAGLSLPCLTPRAKARSFSSIGIERALLWPGSSGSGKVGCACQRASWLRPGHGGRARASRVGTVQPRSSSGNLAPNSARLRALTGPNRARAGCCRSTPAPRPRFQASPWQQPAP